MHKDGGEFQRSSEVGSCKEFAVTPFECQWANPPNPPNPPNPIKCEASSSRARIEANKPSCPSVLGGPIQSHIDIKARGGVTVGQLILAVGDVVGAGQETPLWVDGFAR